MKIYRRKRNVFIDLKETGKSSVLVFCQFPKVDLYCDSEAKNITIYYLLKIDGSVTTAVVVLDLKSRLLLEFYATSSYCPFLDFLNLCKIIVFESGSEKNTSMQVLGTTV